MRAAVRFLLAAGMPAAAAGSVLAVAAEFRSVGDQPAVLYDAPSTKARKQWILSRQYPVEIVVAVEGFSKVRDAQGDFAWVESRLLTDRRTVLVKTAQSDVRAGADEKSALVFQAGQNVVLELIEPPASGWVRVRHADGRSGYVRLADLWGV